MENLGDDLWRHQKGEGHQVANAYHMLWGAEDESFNSFYGKIDEVVSGKFNLEEKTEDSKIVRKILRSLPESFRAKVTTIEESKDLDEIKIQELIGSLQTYELSLPS